MKIHNVCFHVNVHIYILYIYICVCVVVTLLVVSLNSEQTIKILSDKQ